MEKAEKSKNEPGTALAAGEPKKPAQETRAAAQGKRYGEAVKRLVVEQIESGKLTVAQAQRQHGIAGAQTIRGWQARYGKARLGAGGGAGGDRQAAAREGRVGARAGAFDGQGRHAGVCAGGGRGAVWRGL